MSAPEPPRTIAEQLDAADTAEEFAGVLWKLFAAADAARDKAEERTPMARPCPACNAQPGYRCTVPTDTGRRDVAWYHFKREE
jgi:hypothetical protein